MNWRLQHTANPGPGHFLAIARVPAGHGGPYAGAPGVLHSRRGIHLWNFGLRATTPRKPRQARKGATVADPGRAPRITRSSA